MRYVLLSYLSIVLVSITLLIILSINSGFGYVFVQWNDWQIQTNLFIILLLFYFSIVLFYLMWLGIKSILRRYLKKYEIPKSFSKLHPYEKLGILWLLHAERIEQKQIIEAYQPSYVLYPLIRARIALAQKDTITAQTWLKDYSITLFELAELLKIDIDLIGEDYANVLNRLEFLSVHPLSAWLTPVQNAYQNELKEKWFQFAQQCPWWIFKTHHKIDFDMTQKSIWLAALLQQVNEATEEDQHLLSEWYFSNKSEIVQYYVEDQISLLKLMSQFELLNKETFIFAQEIMQYRFVPEVLYIWLDQGFKLKSNIENLQNQVELWETKYPAQPSLIFAKWHIFNKLNQLDKANELLTLYPNDPYMSYIRLNHAIHSSPELKHDLQTVMYYSGQNFKFDL